MSETETPRGGIARKLAEIMQAVDGVAKRGRNDFHKYDYATEADILKAVREEMAKRHLALIPEVVDVHDRETVTAKGNPTAITTADMRFTWIDGDTGEEFAAYFAGRGEDPADKGLYKAVTGAMKYIILKTFLIPTGDDPEGDGASDERAAPAARQAGGGGSERKATAGQVKLMNARAAEAGASKDELAIIVKNVASVEKVEDVPMRLVDAVLGELK